MRKRNVSILLVALLIGGCASNSSSQDAERLRAERAKFNSQVENTPPNANTRFAAGQLAESEGDLPRAIQQYQDALKLDPNHAQSLFRLGYVYTGERKYPQAIEIWNRYIKATHNAAAGYGNLGLCLELAGRASEAESAYKAGVAQDPTNQPCRVNYGLFLARQGRMTEAAEQLQAVLPPASVHYNLASVLESQKKIPQAKAEYQQALQIDPNMTDAKTRLAALK